MIPFRRQVLLNAIKIYDVLVMVFCFLVAISFVFGLYYSRRNRMLDIAKATSLASPAVGIAGLVFSIERVIL